MSDEHYDGPLIYLAGYDGSSAATQAVAVAAGLAEATDAEVVAVTADEHVPLAMAPGPAAAADAEIQQRRREHAEHLLHGLDVPGVDRRLVIDGKPSRALVELADREHAALLAVGATHRGPLGRMAPGTVAERLLHGAPCPVVVVPADAPLGPIRTIGVAYDESDEAGIALGAARRLAANLDAALVVLRVLEPIWVGAGWTVPGAYAVLVPERVASTRRRLEPLAGEAGTEIRILDGDAGPSIVQAVADESIDLLVCGSRSYGPLRAVLAGSVSRYLVDHVHCPVMVVPRGAHVGGSTKDPASIGQVHQ